jgi:putative aminopeptidase FrvX
MLNNSTVYVQTAKGKVAGMIYPKKELGDNKPDHFSEIFLDVIDHQKINIGDFGSYQREFYENGNKIIATGLDNKISVELILELILEYPQLLKTTMFALVTEEETTYDCIAGIADMYKPQYGIVLDMLPVNQISNHKVEILPEIGKGPSILMSMHKYFLHPIIREKLFKLTTPYQKVVVDINFPPEPQLLQRNGVTKGINVLLPMLGWHNRTYSMNKNDYAQMKKLVVELIKIFK